MAGYYFYKKSKDVSDLIDETNNVEDDKEQDKIELFSDYLEIPVISTDVGHMSQILPKELLAEKNNQSALYDLDRWEIFEKLNPQIFSSMYQFWCQKI